MTWIKKNSDGSSNSFNFIPPSGASEQVNEVLFPIADKQEPAYAATVAADIKQMKTFIQPAELTGNLTLNLTIDEQVSPGAMLFVKLDADGTNRTFAPGTGFDDSCADVTVTANTVVNKTYIFDGVAFLPV